VWHRSLIAWPLLAVAFVTTGHLLFADDPPSADGYKDMVVKSADGKSVTLRVQQQPDALAHASFPDELDHQHAFSATNPMASKSFSFPTDAASQGNSEYKNGDSSTFITKSYSSDSNAPSAPDLDRKSDVSANSAFSQTATGFDKGYSTARTDSAQNQTALLASATSPDQGRTAVLGDHPDNTNFASPMSGKGFQGEEADAMHHTLSRMKNGQMLVTDLPDRPLTVDEVRELINHGFKPDTTASPAEASKPLNDPNYVPEPLRENPQPDNPQSNAAPKALPVTPGDDDKDDAVPPPGTMSASPPPENSQPLPQQ
jgi:hypothetical protein